MIPQSRIPTTPHHPLAPILPNVFLYPSFLLLLLTRKNSGNLSKPRNSSRLPGLILSSVYPLKPAKFLFLSCTARIFPKAPSFSPPSSEHPLSVFSPKTPIRRSVPVPAPAPAQNRCRSYKRHLFQSLPLAVPHGSSFFRSPHPPDRRRTVNGPFCVPGSRLLSVYSSSPPDAAPFVPLFVLKTSRLPRPHLAACQSSPSLSHRLETVSFFSKIAAFSFFSGKTTKNLADSIEFFYSKFFQKAMLSPDNSWKSVVFSV